MLCSTLNTYKTKQGSKKINTNKKALTVSCEIWAPKQNNALQFATCLAGLLKDC